MKVVIESSHRRITLQVVKVNDTRFDLKIQMGSRQGQTALSSQKEVDGIILGFIHKLQEDDQRPKEAIQEAV